MVDGWRQHVGCILAKALDSDNLASIPPEPYRAGDAPWLRDEDYSDDPDRFGRATAGYDGRDYLMEA